MGQNQNSPFSLDSALMANYLVQSRDLQLFITRLLHRDSGDQYLMREVIFNQLKQFTQTGQKLKKRKQINNSHLTKLITHEERTQDQMCSAIYKQYTIWLYPNKTLEQEINHHHQSKTLFKDENIWLIVRAVIQAATALEQIDSSHQAISSKNILIDIHGNVMLSDPLATGQPSNLQRFLSTSKLKGVYISPQQCQSIGNKISKTDKNVYKSDVFTFGMVLLQCGLLQSQQTCFIDDGLHINWQILQQNIHRFNSLYDKRLGVLISYILAKQVQNRPDWIELNNIIDTLNSSSRNFTVIPISSNKIQTNLPINVSQKSLTMIPSVSYENSSSLNSQRRLNSQQYASKDSLKVNASSMPQYSILSHSNSANQKSIRAIPIMSNHQTNPVHLIRNKFQISAISENKMQGQLNNKRSNRWPSQIHHNQKQQIFYHTNPIPSIIKPNPNIRQINIQKSYSRQTSQKNIQLERQFVQEHFKMGSRYQGYKQNGMRNGWGKFYYQDGGYYEGEWKNNKMTGFGKLYYQSNLIAYEGQWLNDQFHGKGIIVNQHPILLPIGFDFRNFDGIQDFWEFYEGYFFQDMKNGRGRLKFSNGEIFQGQFKEDMVEGEGIFWCLGGQNVRGRWSQNQLIQVY